MKSDVEILRLARAYADARLIGLCGCEPCKRSEIELAYVRGYCDGAGDAIDRLTKPATTERP